MPISTPPIAEFEQTPLWISHHHHGQAHRCTRVGNRFVCRRCLVLYPLVIAVAVVTAAANVPGSPLLMFITASLLVPFLADWVSDHLGLVVYSASRSAVVSAVGALGLGLALGVHVRDPLDPWVTIPVAITSVTALATVVVGGLRRHVRTNAAHDWESVFTADETRRREHLDTLLGTIEGHED